MEQIVVIVVFSLCAAVCVKIMAVSYLMTVNAVDTKNALLIAESAAESYKAFAKDTSESIPAYYDKNWNPCDESNASFILHLTERKLEPSILLADIAVNKITTNEKLVNLTVAARRGEQ